MTRKERGWVVAPAAGAVLWIAASILPAPTPWGVVPAQAGDIGWEKPGGAFQACLSSKAKAWIAAKVELVVNEDPDMGAVDDATVAQWATQALRECTDKAAADPASEQQFMKYMAYWRDHIYAAANEIRARARPD